MMTEFKMVEPSRQFGKGKPTPSYCTYCSSSYVLKIYSSHKLRSVKCYSCLETEIINGPNAEEADSNDTSSKEVRV